MPRVRPQLGLVSALLVPQLARADQFRVPEDKHAVEVTIAIENLDAHPEYLFVLWPDACLLNDENSASHTVLNSEDDDGRANFLDEGCETQRLFAFPSDTYTGVDGVLAENGLRQLGTGPPSDPRVLVQTIEAEQRWLVPLDVDLYRIQDVYRVAVDGGTLILTPTRVRFDFGQERIWERSFYKGRRPRLPRPQDVPPPPPPPEPAAPTPAIAETSAEAKVEAPAAAASETKVGPAATPASTSAPSPTPAPAGDHPSGEISAKPWPPPLLYGGACLLVAVAAGVALRRRG
ncbi:hypothetical protein SAMN02745121_03523 [Nannocystis exedens]|uniref:Uncharacterized protein n=1 Tax=Nannocystis exedens TaxID=54 RepID=A0A1I1YXD9_9BACT|nr:hypothetical protein [Nannocystis exedens]PCC70156.1 hypothetical protein NAEX_03189 [Nannocystis exedens]SFE22710.1 hypothetical protein SAMN02745121_03523 [Nannocystis exedens]